MPRSPGSQNCTQILNRLYRSGAMNCLETEQNFSSFQFVVFFCSTKPGNLEATDQKWAWKIESFISQIKELSTKCRTLRYFSEKVKCFNPIPPHFSNPTFSVKNNASMKKIEFSRVKDFISNTGIWRNLILFLRDEFNTYFSNILKFTMPLSLCLSLSLPCWK